MGFRSGLPQPHSSIYLIPLWLAILKQPSPCVPGAHVENDDSDPPKKRGGMRSQKEVRCGIPLFARMTGRYRPHLSLREGIGTAPFPLALHCVGSVLAVKGSLRRFAPWTAPGRSERRAVHEGKGGGGPWGARTGCQAHDKGYYHSYLGRRTRRKEPFAEIDSTAGRRFGTTP